MKLFSKKIMLYAIISMCTISAFLLFLPLFSTEYAFTMRYYTSTRVENPIITIQDANYDVSITITDIKVKDD